MNSFRTGSVAIATGVTDFPVAVSLYAAPVHVIVSVRQPAQDAPIVSAYVTGEPTAESFTVALSAPVESAGYRLEWTAFMSELPPAIAGDTNAISYDDLKKIVANYLGWDAENLTDYQADRVDWCIQSGVRRFYYPPAMDGVDVNFEWSFIRQRGGVSVVAGTDNYTLPDGFGRMAGQLVIEGECGPTIPVVPWGDMAKMRSRGETGRPRFASVIADQSFGSRGQAKRLFLYPCPDRDCLVSFVCDADTGKLDPETRPFPLGGAMFSELVKEACLSVAENDINDTAEIHTQNFNSLLVSMIQRDRKSSAQVFGPVGDKGYSRPGADPFPFIRNH